MHDGPSDDLVSQQRDEARATEVLPPLLRPHTVRWSVLLPAIFAATLLQRSFVSVGRNPAVMELLKTGDVLAFRQAQSGVDTFAAPYHLMMVVRPGGADRHQLVVIYHTGDADQGVRAGSLREYLTGAPAEWQPAETNPSFLGFYRFKGWVHD